jgi:hypothetical protein
MLGVTLVGDRLKDLRAVLGYLKNREDIEGSRLAIWGDSLSVPDHGGEGTMIPMGMEKQPSVAEPLGGLLGLLAALFEDEIIAVYVFGGLTGFESALNSPFCGIPHDVVVPGAVSAGDLPLLAEVMQPTRLRLDGLVDGLNRRVHPESAERLYDETVVGTEDFDGLDVSGWLLESLGVSGGSLK